jgi:hypothetical protein
MLRRMKVTMLLADAASVADANLGCSAVAGT